MICVSEAFTQMVACSVDNLLGGGGETISPNTTRFIDIDSARASCDRKTTPLEASCDIPVARASCDRKTTPLEPLATVKRLRGRRFP